MCMNDFASFWAGPARSQLVVVPLLTYRYSAQQTFLQRLRADCTIKKMQMKGGILKKVKMAISVPFMQGFVLIILLQKSSQLFSTRMKPSLLMQLKENFPKTPTMEWSGGTTYVSWSTLWLLFLPRIVSGRDDCTESLRLWTYTAVLVWTLTKGLSAILTLINSLASLHCPSNNGLSIPC